MIVPPVLDYFIPDNMSLNEGSYMGKVTRSDTQTTEFIFIVEGEKSSIHELRITPAPAIYKKFEEAANTLETKEA